MKNKMMMEVSSLLSLPDGLKVAQLAIVDDMLHIDVVATAEGRPCPLCAEVATQVCAVTTRGWSQIYLALVIASSSYFMFASFAAIRLPVHAKSSPSDLAHLSKPGRAKRHDSARPSRPLVWPRVEKEVLDWPSAWE